MLADYTGPVPEGFDVIELPAADYLMFQGEPFAEEDYEKFGFQKLCTFPAFFKISGQYIDFDLMNLCLVGKESCE